MPQTGAAAKGFQDSGVQSGSDQDEPATGADKAAEPADPADPTAGDEPDRVAIVELDVEVDDELALLSVAGGGGGGKAAPAADGPYPDFPETNPFRLAEVDRAASPPASVRRREPARQGSAESLARRRGSASELKVTIPPAAGSGAVLVAQRAVSRDSDPSGGGGARRGELERRDSIWDRLPPPDQAPRRASDQDGASAAARLLRSPFTLSQPTPTPDQTNDEGRELFLEFVRDRIEEDIQDEELVLQTQNDDYFNRIMALPGLSNPVWAQTGTELRALADAFATSHQRQELRCKAHQTDLTDISWDRFRQLLEELFSGEAGVTQERILVLFFFLSDCVVATIRRHAWSHLRRLIEWSLRYIVERVCALVQQAGGWSVVLHQSAEYMYMAVKITAYSLVCVAAFVYIRNSWH